MAGFWSATGDEHKSIRELAYGYVSNYEPPTDHDVNSYRDFYGHFHSPEPQHMDPNDYSNMYHSPQGENEHFYSAQLRNSSLLDQLEAQITALEMQIHEKSVASNSPRKSEIYTCTLCGSLGHPVENCYTLHDFRQSREYHAPMYQSTQWEVEQFRTPLTSCRKSVEENLVFLEQNNTRFELNLLHDKPYSNASEYSFCSDPHAQPCNEYPYAIPTLEDSHSMGRINAYLDMILLHVQKEGNEEFHDEMFVIPNELNVESNMFSPSYATDIKHEPNLEVNDWTRDTMIVNRASHFCYDDDDDYDFMLEEHVYAENIVETLGSETLGFSASTFMNDISSSIPYTCDVDIDLEPVQVFCEDERDLGKVELSVDTNDRMHETIIDVSDSLTRSQYDLSFELPMHEIEVLNDVYDIELGLDDLFCENE